MRFMKKFDVQTREQKDEPETVLKAKISDLKFIRLIPRS
jgi:hypothetical protein